MQILGKGNEQIHSLSGGTLLLSPHCDDIAFALGGHLLGRAFPPPVTVVTVFTKSNYTLSQRFSGSADVVTVKRKREEKQFLESVGAGWIDCDLPEASLRGYQTHRELFGGVKTYDPIHQELEAALVDVTSRMSEVLIGLPSGLGNHADHIIVRDVARSQLSRLRVQLLFYEELPYAARYKGAEIEEIVHTIVPGAVPRLFDISSLMGSKVKALSAYSSQVGTEEIEAVVRYATSLCDHGGATSFERVWVT